MLHMLRGMDAPAYTYLLHQCVEVMILYANRCWVAYWHHGSSGCSCCSNLHHQTIYFCSVAVSSFFRSEATRCRQQCQNLPRDSCAGLSETAPLLRRRLSLAPGCVRDAVAATGAAADDDAYYGSWGRGSDDRRNCRRRWVRLKKQNHCST